VNEKTSEMVTAIYVDIFTHSQSQLCKDAHCN